MAPTVTTGLDGCTGPGPAVLTGAYRVGRVAPWVNFVGARGNREQAGCKHSQKQCSPHGDVGQVVGVHRRCGWRFQNTSIDDKTAIDAFDSPMNTV